MADSRFHDVIEALLDDAEKLSKEREDVLERQGANRSILRNYVKLGHVSAQQAKQVEEFYPTRTRGEGEGENGSQGQEAKQASKS